MVSLIQNFNSTINLVNPRYKSIVNTSVASTGLALAALFAPWEAVKIVGLTVLTGVSYGIANDMIACRDCIEYFTVGHIYDDKNLRFRPIKTLNPNLNAIVWGMIATWHVSAIAGSVFAFVAQAHIPGLVLKVSAAKLAPYLAATAALTFLLAHVNSRLAQGAMNKNPNFKYRVPIEFQARWEACNIRNLTGYAAIGLGGIALSIAILATRIGLIRM